MAILSEQVLYVSDLKPIEAILRRTSIDPESECPETAVLDLTGATIQWVFTRLADGEAIERDGTVESASLGHVSYTFEEADFDTDFTIGNYKVFIRAELTNGEDFVVESRHCPTFRVAEDPFGR